jgi:NAD(P)-dependent dehydrogenase (short-subunit alcohol dehydrogenase family)
MNSATPVALVTGGARGIGQGIVRRLLERHYAVVIADNDVEGAESACSTWKMIYRE